MKKNRAFDLSIVIPVYNEEQGIAALAKALNKLKSSFPAKTELILVNDGSTDKTEEKIKKTSFLFPLKLISFSRNFGHQAALLAGMRESQGKAVVSMDGDLQHPPELISELYKKYKKGFAIVLTNRVSTQNISWFKRFSSNFFYTLINSVSDTHISKSASDFRLISRPALDALLQLPEKRIFLRGLVNWIGFSSTTIPYHANERKFGVSKYSLRKMILLAFAGLTAFSTAPLYISALSAFFLTFGAFLYGCYVLYVSLTGRVVEGWSSVILVQLIVGGVLSTLFAIIGVYLAAIYEEIKARPDSVISGVTTIKPKRKKAA